MPEMFGPFSPYCTNRIVHKAGEIVGIKLGDACEGVAVFRPLIGAGPRGRATHGDLVFEPPIPVFARESLNISFELEDGSPAPGEPEAWLLMRWGDAG